jgi:hypothetical protein
MEECERLYAPVQKARKAGNKAAQEAAYAAFDKWRSRIVATQLPLDLRDMPRFVCRPSITGDLKKVILDLGLLVFINGLFFTLSFIAFLKYDVRSD